MVYLEVELKAISSYFLMLIFIKLVGKAGFAQLTPYDLTFVFIIGVVLASPLTNTGISYIFSFLVFLIGLVMQQVFSRLPLKNKIRPLVENIPTVIIIDGNIIPENMAKTQFDMVQLLVALRLKEIRNISEVELGTLEPNGEFSIISKSNEKDNDPTKSSYLNLKEETLRLLNNNQKKFLRLFG